MDLEALSDFVLAAQHGGYGAASRASARSKASIARRVADLEGRLGVRLFERGHAGLRLTDAGSELLGRIAGPFREIEEASKAVGPENTGLKGRLRISAAVVFAHAHLVRIAAGFARLHPGVEIEIVADDDMIDLVEDRFDIVIRANPSPSEQLVGKCITRTDRVAVAAPSLPMPADGERTPLVCRGTEHSTASWHLMTEAGPRELLLRPRMKLSTLLMVHQAALHGAGVALLPRTLVADDLAMGSLACWGIEAGATTELWALHAASRLASAKVTCFLRYLEEALRSSEPSQN